MKQMMRVVVVLLTCWLTFGPGPAQVLAGSGQVNINTAGVKEFQTLPFIGEARALAIVRAREAKGGFGSVGELRDIPDIGDRTFLAIRPYLTLSGASSPPGNPAEGYGKVASMITTQPGEVRLLTDQEYYPALEGMISHATSSIDLVMFLFKVTDSSRNQASALVQELISAHKRGVAISVLLERSGYDPELNRENERIGARLAKEGITVRFDSKKTTTHAKVVVIDRRYSLVGSHNFTGSALSYNHEATLLVDNRTLATELVAYMGMIQ